MLRRPSPRLMIDRVQVMPRNTEMRPDGFPLRDDSDDPDDGTEFECAVNDARAYSSAVSFDERMAEQFRDMGSSQYVILFVTDPGIQGPGRKMLWKSNGLGSQQRTFDPPIELISTSKQLEPNGGRFVWRVGADVKSM